ncbi:conserved hypothetical protein [Shewanella halifaxensis HAW-EB4]|uniref:DUF805 domain-containing protein n=1 Tax=Shewanella halifaxensis (strain HAW-EB4) TaxID=458817 RepID=B0TQH5_SHEHH|nr:hypothetical protein [Shewanella halifaxensis]ABZ74968.1 conserved hypothetical protein [Shewanella halifaxensis HAW-EB4]
MQVKSFFCVNGLDSGQRFATISGLIYFTLLLAVVIFSPSLALYFVGLLLTPVLAFTSLRRLRDCAKPPQLALLTLVPFWLALITLVHVHSMMLLLTLLVIAGLAIGYLAVLPAASRVDYVQGYAGPVDMSSSKGSGRMANFRVRVEPTLGGEEVAESMAINSTDETYPRAEEQQAPEAAREYQQHSRRGKKQAALNMAQLQSLLLTNKKIVFIAAGSVVGVMLMVSLLSLIPASEADIETASDSDSKVVNETLELVPVNRISTSMPDGFSLALEDDVLIMRWLGETGSPVNLWSLATAKGDKTCSLMRFNNGTEYRPLMVDLLADTGTEARFSPLDTEAIIVDMARRGNVSLCGYNFSLKGSQAALGKVAAFRTYL